MIGLAILAAAQAPAIISTIVVTSSRLREEDQAGQTIIETEEIGQLQPITVLDVLDTVPGVHAFTKSGPGGTSYVGIRGGEPNFTLVLVDNVRLNDPTNSQGGGFDFAQIDPFVVARIDVQREALSAVHGSDALAGAITLHLREPRVGETSIGARLTTGTEDVHGAGMTLAKGWSDGGVLASGSLLDAKTAARGSTIRRGQGFVKLIQRIGDAKVSALFLHAGTGRQGFPEDSGGPRLAVIRDLERRDTRLNLTALNLSGSEDAQVQPVLSMEWSRQDAAVRTPPIAPGVIDGVPSITSDSSFNRLAATAYLRMRTTESAAFVLGASLLREVGRSRGTIDLGFALPAGFRLGRSVVSACAETELRPARSLSINAGLRLDRPDALATERTGRFAVRFATSRHGPTLFASLAQGFKLPSLYALGYPLIANPQLKPERSQSLQIGMQYRVSGGRIELAAFSNRFTNLIDFDPEHFTNVNRSRVTTRGVEAAVEFRPREQINVRANLTYLDVDAPAGVKLRSRPRWQGTASLTYQPSHQFGLFAALQGNSAYFDSSVPTGIISQPGHAELNAGGSYRLSNALTARITLRNLADRYFEQSVGFREAGRQLTASLTAGW